MSTAPALRPKYRKPGHCRTASVGELRSWPEVARLYRERHPDQAMGPAYAQLVHKRALDKIRRALTGEIGGGR